MQNLKIRIKDEEGNSWLKQNKLFPETDYLCLDVAGRGMAKEYTVANADGALIDVPSKRVLVMGVWPETVQIVGMGELISLLEEVIIPKVEVKLAPPPKKPAPPKPPKK